jgi:hypothetical protein
MASWIIEMVVSILRRRVLGLVIVVPRLACRPCPRLNGIPHGEEGVPGETGEAIESPLMAASRPKARLEGEMGVANSSTGVWWLDGFDCGFDMYALVSSALKSSGGRRSFSISDFRLLNINA